MQNKCNTAKLGKDQKKMLKFVMYNEGLHSISKDKDTQRIAHSLARRGLIVINEFNQISFVKES